MRLDPDQESTLAFIQVRCKGREAMRYRRVHIHPQEYGKSAINCPCYSAEATGGGNLGMWQLLGAGWSSS